MNTTLLEYKNVTAGINTKTILKNFSFKINTAGELHVIMGENGCGKSTMSKLLVGHPTYEVKNGQLLYETENKKIINLVELEPPERSLLGLFLGFQSPVEITGISNLDFLYEIYNQHATAQNRPIYENKFDFERYLIPFLQEVNLDQSFLYRNINEGFSGGEKKRNELLQLLLLNPKVVILDEIDSGLDINSMNIAANIIRKLVKNNTSIILISHYTNFIKQFKELENKLTIHIMKNGRIERSGNLDLLHQIEKEGFK